MAKPQRVTSLVSQAIVLPMSKRPRGDATRDEAELAVAWAQGVVTTGQAQQVLGLKHQASIYVRLALAFRAGIRAGSIKSEWDEQFKR